jgi:hypothetical protein
MVGIEVEIGITLNAMIGVGVIKTVEVMEIKILSCPSYHPI